LTATPQISVVLPVFNGEKYLKEAIDSILRQTFTDFELVVVNDGSTDRSEQIIKEYSDPRIRYLGQKNAGVGMALQAGCSLAKGAYIARMDADDISFPERLEIQRQYLEEHPGTAMVSCAVRYINAGGEVTGRSFPYIFNFCIRKKLREINPICHPGVMMRKEAYRKSIGYLNIQPFEDHLLWISMSGLGKIHNFTFPLLKYRVLNDSVSRGISVQQHKMLFRHLYDKLKKGGLDENAIAGYRQRYLEEKLKATDRPDLDRSEPGDNPSHSSPAQERIYRLMQKSGLPDRFIERIICSLKSIFLVYR
jgi:glycosyltransferase involved in cell wall biosynthesis